MCSPHAAGFCRGAEPSGFLWACAVPNLGSSTGLTVRRCLISSPPRLPSRLPAEGLVVPQTEQAVKELARPGCLGTCSSGELTLVWKVWKPAGEVSDDSDALSCPRPQSLSATVHIRFVSSELNPAYVPSPLKTQTDSRALTPMFSEDSPPGSVSGSLETPRGSLFLISPSRAPYTGPLAAPAP